ncbi:MAG TPA: carboxypeptidase-like regulatory domain-containing protein [Candidatus Acidoferrales bacterium]|nr:carboxypeptidase-like regulatory domain-containing protein [Candidatus Acidoferrales bacterium]
MKIMRRLPIVGLLICLAAIFSVSLASAQTKSSKTPKVAPTTGTLTGEVRDKHGTPLAGSGVTAASSDGKQTASSTTDAGGIFRIDSLAPGEYQINFSAKGFLPATAKAKIKAGKTTKISARLKFITPDS